MLGGGPTRRLVATRGLDDEVVALVVRRAEPGKVIIEWHDRWRASTEAVLSGPISRVSGAISQVALLADEEIRGSASRLSEALTEVIRGYATDEGFRPEGGEGRHDDGGRRIGGGCRNPHRGTAQ